jgi:PTH1 family peptidyl-tRNA hydrolase
MSPLRVGSRRKETPVSLIVLGLGNPGSEYRDTRHNLGFRCVDAVAARLGGQIKPREGKSLVGRVRHPGPAGRRTSVLLAKPQTYMNLSGKAAVALLQKHNLTPDDLWVVYDELDLPFGKIRIRKHGSDGGHNGVASLIEELGTQRFVRFRLGVGRPPEGDPMDHLLAPFTPDESERVPELVQLGGAAIVDGLTDGIDVAMTRYNGKSV